MKKKSLPVYNLDDFTFEGDEKKIHSSKINTKILLDEIAIRVPHALSFYACLICTKGSGIHEIDFNSYKVKPGIVHVIFPGQVHNWILSTDFEGFRVFHTCDFNNLNFINNNLDHFPFFSSTQNSPVISIPKAHLQKIKDLFIEIIDEENSDKLMKYQKIGSILNVLYIELSRLYLPESTMVKHNHRQLRTLKNLVELINLNFKQIKSPSEYAEMMNMSAKNLNRICKSSLNKTITELITDRIVLEAKRMLMHSTYSVSQIADELGYIDNTYFFRMFKKNTGQTPLAFLKKFRKSELSQVAIKKRVLKEVN